jgi:hypothetical protein
VGDMPPRNPGDHPPGAPGEQGRPAGQRGAGICCSSSGPPEKMMRARRCLGTGEQNQHGRTQPPPGKRRESEAPCSPAPAAGSAYRAHMDTYAPWRMAERPSEDGRTSWRMG